MPSASSSVLGQITNRTTRASTADKKNVVIIASKNQKDQLDPNLKDVTAATKDGTISAKDLGAIPDGSKTEILLSDSVDIKAADTGAVLGAALNKLKDDGTGKLTIALREGQDDDPNVLSAATMYPGPDGKPVPLSALLFNYNNDLNSGVTVAYNKKNGVTQIEITRHGIVEIKLPTAILPKRIPSSKFLIKR
jgi:hypothetical protein